MSHIGLGITYAKHFIIYLKFKLPGHPVFYRPPDKTSKGLHCVPELHGSDTLQHSQASRGARAPASHPSRQLLAGSALHNVPLHRTVDSPVPSPSFPSGPASRL